MKVSCKKLFDVQAFLPWKLKFSCCGQKKSQSFFSVLVFYVTDNRKMNGCAIYIHELKINFETYQNTKTWAMKVIQTLLPTPCINNPIYLEKIESIASSQDEQENVDNLGINFCRGCRVLFKLSISLQGRVSFPRL